MVYVVWWAIVGVCLPDGWMVLLYSRLIATHPT